jgi:hypothetical protein
MVQMDGVSDSVGGGNSAQTEPQTEPDKVKRNNMASVLCGLCTSAADCLQSRNPAVLYMLNVSTRMVYRTA